MPTDLSQYVAAGGNPTARITDAVVIEFIDQLLGARTEARDSCPEASNEVDYAEFNVMPSPTDDNTPPPTQWADEFGCSDGCTAAHQRSFAFSSIQVILLLLSPFSIYLVPCCY
ncbi:hypothetical protein B0H19DRAFT_1262540 [Mycena capillaripes]|nr:hypothetical protein B0H19DRAFT_1262540 [Mycena capillaripes]